MMVRSIEKEADGMRSIRFNIAVYYSRAKTEETVPNARNEVRGAGGSGQKSGVSNDALRWV